MVLYSINGRYFRELDLYVSKSEGIGSVLKRKPVQSYDWPEYDGVSVDLTNPKFEARTIELECFMIGSTWQEILYRFNSIIRDEFAKPGLQRFTIEFPTYGYDPLLFMVYMQEGVELQKRFKSGKVVGTFKLTLIEPNPFKRVFYTTSDKISLTLNGDGEYDIFWPDGSQDTFRDTFSVVDKPLSNRNVSGYAYPGRNFFTGGRHPVVFAANDFGALENVYSGVVNGKDGVMYQAAQGKNISMYAPAYVKNLVVGKKYIFSCWIGQHLENTQKTAVFQLDGAFYFSAPIPYYNYVKITKEFVYSGGNNLIGFSADSNSLDIVEISITETDGAYKIAPEAEKYIIVAGNIAALNSSSNATELWARI